jgi:hypothetical protein
MGAMLAERSEVAPIIRDDALGYCDDDRIERMFDALSKVRCGGATARSVV